MYSYLAFEVEVYWYLAFEAGWSLSAKEVDWLACWLVGWRWEYAFVLR